MTETLIVMGDNHFRELFDDELLAELASATRLGEPVQTAELTGSEVRARLAEVDILLTGWGCPPLDADVLAAAPALRAVVHAAGSVRHHVTDACWARGIRVSTAAEANAVPVAEYALAAVLFAGKRVPTLGALAGAHRGTTAYRDTVGPLSNYRRTVGVLGFSRIGRRLVDLLRPFDLRVLVADPYASAADVTAAGATLVSLDELLPACDVLSIHAPLLPETRGMLDATRLSALPTGATVVNTARGGLIDHAALAAECASGRLSAILDVTEPEPLPASSPLYDLPNVLLTPHVAGALGSETRRLAASAVSEVARFADGHLAYEVTLADLGRIA